MENAELKDKLTELGEEFEAKGYTKEHTKAWLDSINDEQTETVDPVKKDRQRWAG